jgi:DNA repair exonuclease SbcCD ATPase subunit
VYISNLYIDRFGIWRDLNLDSFSDGLNVVYGPNGSGKSTVIQFIRSILYGFEQDVRKRYAADDIASVGGAITVHGVSGRRTIRRYDDGDEQGRLTVKGDDGSFLGQDTVAGILGKLPKSVFDRVFAAQFQGDRGIDRLIEQVVSHGYDLVGQPADVDKLAALKEQLRDRQRELAALQSGDETFDQLTSRRRDLEKQIEAIMAAGADRRASVDRQLRKLDGESAELEEQQEELREELRSLDAQIEAREAERLRKEQEFRAARHEHMLARTGRREALRDIDAQLERWQCVLQDVEARGRQMRGTTELATTLEPDGPADPRPYLRRLESRIDELQKQMADSARTLESDICQCQSWRSMFEPALREMREDVYRLCNEISRWEKATSRTRVSSELGQLGRCEAELRTAIAGLSQRRQKLLAEISQAGDVVGDLLAPHDADLCACRDHSDQIENWTRIEELSAAEEKLLASLAAEIQRMSERRQETQRDLMDLADGLQTLQQRRRQLEAECEPRDTDHRLETLRLEGQRVDEQLARLERRRDLLQVITRLERDINALEASLRQATVLREAVVLLRQLTDGELREVTLSSQRELSIHTRDGECLSYQQLGTGARDQVVLSLCLALAAAHGRRGTRLPLILNDALANIDTQGVRAAAKVLHQFAAGGQQVLLFTRHQHVADIFRTAKAAVRNLQHAGNVVEPPVEIEVPTPPAMSEAKRHEVNQQLSLIADEMDDSVKVVEYAACNTEEFPGELTDRVRPAKRVETSASLNPLVDVDAADYFLFETSPIQDAPSIDAATAERFRKIDVLLVRDLLRLNVNQAADRLRYAGITASMIRRWQSEARLTCSVPHLRPYDARILVGCGIDDADQLAGIEAAELRRRVERFAATSTGQVMLRSGNRYELSRLTDWIAAARRRQGRRSGRQSYSRSASASSDHSSSQSSGSSSRHSSRDSYREAGHRTDRSSAQRRHWQSSSERTARSERQTASGGTYTSSGSQRTKDEAVVLKMEQSGETWRFYLNRADSIEAAPSIGPRMAERFEEIGIMTVADFLSADAETMAAQLDRSRVTAETVRAWQQQTTLACRIPWLRGHDAQILVACGIEDVESLAAMDADELWKTVRPFVATKQCKRIIRNGKAPDLEEVQDWIQWARNARLLRAA